MKNIRRSETFCAVMLLIILAFCGSLAAIGQPPAQTLTQTSDQQTTTQTSPKPQIKDPKVKAFDEKVKLAQSLVTEGGRFMKLGTAESKVTAEAKLFEAIELSRNLYEKLNDKNLSENIAQTGETKADYQTLLKMFQSAAHVALGNLYEVSRDWQNSANHKKLALAVLQEIFADAEMRASKIFDYLANTIKHQELTTLEGLTATLSGNLDKQTEALEYANQALTLARRLQREDEKLSGTAKLSEADTLQRIGLIYLKMDDRPKTIEYYKQALSVYQSLPDQKHQVANLLHGIGSEYFSELDYENALEYLKKALKVAEEIDDQAQQSRIFGHFAVIYDSLGNEAKAREFWHQGLAILLSPDYTGSLKRIRSRGRNVSEANPDSPDIAAIAAKNDEFFRLLGVAHTYQKLKDYAQSISFYEQTLAVARSMKSPIAEQLVLSSIGNMYVEKEDWQKALDSYQQSLEISRQLSQKSEFASDLKNLGYIYFEIKNWKEALQNANESLLMYLSLDADKENLDPGYASTLSVIARTHEALGNRRLAIFFGKQAVNAIQRERQQLKNRDREEQSGYLKKSEKPYNRLSDSLIAEGRIAEAEQVLALFKQDEYFDSLTLDQKLDAIKNQSLDKILLTDAERLAFNHYEELANQLAAIGKELGALEKKSENFEAGKFPEQTRLDQLGKDMAQARTVFNKFLEELNAGFRSLAQNLPQPSYSRGLLRRLGQPRTAIVSTIVGEDRLNLIVTTARTYRAYTVDIKAADLNRLVVEFREAVKNPKAEPRPAGKKLYDVLFPAGLRRDLANVKADTIIWSLDGTLRYAPIAALWDGRRYLIERYANSIITLASRNKLNQPLRKRANWTALGVGVSQGGQITEFDGTELEFAALPAVKEELCGVVNDPQKKRFCAQFINVKSGILNGRNLSDEEFTLESLKLNFGRYPVVHVASHFRLNPGNETTSYLLLGGRNIEERKLTLAAARDELGRKFEGVELLTLSACNTAMSGGDKGNGAEVESFGALAQNLGAKTVLATLWSVNDSSTRDVMVEFYREMKVNRQMGKAEALRKAQLLLLQGEYKAGEVPMWRRGLRISKVEGSQTPSFERDKKAKYTHPYFWSPFVLMGNWR